MAHFQFDFNNFDVVIVPYFVLNYFIADVLPWLAFIFTMMNPL